MTLPDKIYVGILADGNPAIVQDEYAVPYVREDRWQPIETAPRDEKILCIDENGDQQTCTFYSNGVFSHGCYIPTHWMPLPSPPQALTEAPKVDVAAVKRDCLKAINIFQIPEFVVADAINYVATHYDLVKKSEG